MRVREALKLKWTDRDIEIRTVHIAPEKGSLLRIFPLSETAIMMLNRLPNNVLQT